MAYLVRVRTAAAVWPVRARELSLDNTRDSPFSLLAKENDIMWGGGMPDDITVVALRVINRAGSSAAVRDVHCLSTIICCCKPLLFAVNHYCYQLMLL